MWDLTLFLVSPFLPLPSFLTLMHSNIHSFKFNLFQWLNHILSESHRITEIRSMQGKRCSAVEQLYIQIIFSVFLHSTLFGIIFFGQFFFQVVLSACSSYFQKLLIQNPCNHPTIIMPPDVPFNDLKIIIDFVYRGEIDVDQTQLQVIFILVLTGFCFTFILFCFTLFSCILSNSLALVFPKSIPPCK